MSTPTRAVGQQAKERRRQLILASAKSVFAQKGYHATTMGDVAKASEISYGSVYWYFDSKETLFHALMDSEELALREHIASAVNGSRGEAMFRSAVRATFEFFESDREVVTLLFRDALAFGERFDRHLSGIYEGFIDEIESGIERAQSDGRIIDASPRMIAFSVAALVSQLALRRLSTDDGVGAAVVADFVVGLLLDGLRPR